MERAALDKEQEQRTKDITAIRQLLAAPVPMKAAEELVALPVLLANGRRRRPGFAPTESVDVKEEKVLVRQLVKLLISLYQTQGLSPVKLAGLKSTSPWREACCQEYQDATLASFLLLKPPLALDAPCWITIAGFIWTPHSKGSFLRKYLAQRRSIHIFHPPDSIMAAARQHADPHKDIWLTVLMLYAQRE